MGAPFSVDGDPPVRGRLHAASGPDALVLTHGAGSDHRSPLLAAVADAFAAEGVRVLRCDLPFRQMRASGPPSSAGAARDRRGLAVALDAVPAIGRRFVGGHSYGGRPAHRQGGASRSSEMWTFASPRARFARIGGVIG